MPPMKELIAKGRNNPVAVTAAATITGLLLLSVIGGALLLNRGDDSPQAAKPTPTPTCASGWYYNPVQKKCMAMPIYPEPNAASISPSPEESTEPYLGVTEEPTEDEYAKDDTCDEEDYLGGCDFAVTQTCVVAAYYAKDGQTSLIEAFIEDELSVDAPDIKAKCPKYMRAWQTAQRGFNDGSYEVGSGKDEIKPGTYKTTSEVNDCYWERTNGNGDIISNNFITHAKSPRVTIRSRDASFTSENCGYWIPG